MPSSTEFDTSNLYLWAQRVTVTDANGFPIEETLTFDDGTTRNTTFSEGLRTGSSWSDPGDIQNWASISVAFDGVTGLPISKTWTLDNGPTITLTFVDGVQTSYTRTDVSDIYDWSSVMRTYGSSGEITSKVITDDNGKVSTTSYVNGIKTELSVSDGGGTYAWSSKTYDYDAAGQLLTTTTLFDDGTSQVVVPAGGPAAQSVTRLDTSNLYSWARFVKTYDAGGLLEEKVWTFDDEVIKTSTYSAGVKVQDDWVDTLDARDWANVTFTYDAAGRIASKNVTNDDGRHVVTSFTDGVRTAQVITDTNNAYGWSSQSRSYDSASRVESLVTNFDDGTISTKSYVAGVLQDEVVTDPLGAHAWTTIHHVHSATNGTLLYTHTVLDDGSETYVDERGFPIAASGTGATVTEDSAATLQASGTIALVDDYRGADDFTAIASVVGDNGYGTFTLNTDGTWSYAALNDQAAIQTLEAGDTLTDSFTAITTDGVETTVTVTINGAVGNDAPVFIGAEPVLLAQAGNRVTAGGSVDFLPLFSDALGDVITLSMATVPAGFAFANGVLSLTDFTNETLVGDHIFTVTATDQLGATVTQSISMTVALDHDFGTLGFGTTLTGTSENDFLAAAGGFGNEVFNINTGDGDDTVQLGRFIGAYSSNFTITTGAGNDFVDFVGDSTAANNGTVLIETGTGDDLIELSAAAATQGGTLTIRADDGADRISIGGNAALGFRAVVDVDGGRGDDDILFGSAAAADDGTVIVTGGEGNDLIRFDINAAANGEISVFGGSGEDTISFDDEAATGGQGATARASVTVDSGADDDSVAFGNSAANLGGIIAVTTGDGDDSVSFGADAARNVTSGTNIRSSTPSSITIDTGTGDDAINFAEVAARGLSEIFVTAGSGEDTITFGEDAANDEGHISVNAGADNDAIVFGEDAGADDSGLGTGTISIEAGTGADTISFGDNAHDLSIDLGADTDVDTLTFDGTVYNAVITNWVQGDDVITFANPTAATWTAVDSGADRVFTSSDGQSFTVVDAAGYDATDIVSGITVNDTPEFVGATEISVGTVGNQIPSATSFDLNTLFSDGNDASLTLTLDAVPAGLAFTNGVLSIIDASTVDAVGDHTIAVTATDAAGASVTQSITLTYATDHDFSAAALGGIVYLGATNGSSDVDTMTFGDLAASLSTPIVVNAFDGADIIDFGNNVARLGDISVFGGDGADVITFGNDASDNDWEADYGHFTGSVTHVGFFTTGAIDVDGGAGDDIIQFGDNAGAQTYTLVAGNTTHLGHINVTAGVGADTIQFGTGAGVLSIDLGDDTDVDTLTFGGTVEDVTITNWDQGEDTITFAAQPGVVWGVSDDGGDRVFTSADGTQSFTVVGAAGVAGGDIVSGLEINQAPTFEGATTTLPNGTVGSNGAAYSQDLNGLFADANSALGDSITLTTSTSLPAGMTFTNGVLNAANSAGLGGDYTITVIATDSFGASVEQDLTFSLAVDNDFGNAHDVFYGGAVYFGSSLADTMILGNTTQEGAAVDVVSGAGADVITVGTNVGQNFGMATIDAGTGADAVTIGTGAGNVTIDLGADTDADTLTFTGTVHGVSISNWVQGDDAITFGAATGLWTAADVAGNKVFTSNNFQTFTVTGAAGVEASDIVSGLAFNTAPTFTGGADPLADATVGSEAVAFSYDIAALFTDANLAGGDSFTVTLDAIPTGFTFLNGVLAPVDATDPSLAGSYTVMATATDTSGASVTQSLSFDLAFDHDFGQIASNSSATVTGSEIDDVMVFDHFSGASGGTLNIFGLGGADTFHFGNHAGSLGTTLIDLTQGTDGDTLVFGSDAGSYFRAGHSNLTINLSAGSDSITFGAHAARAEGTVNISAGAGADMIRFIGGEGRPDGSFGEGRLNIDLGLDSDVDTLIFGGTVQNTHISNWVQGVDTVDVDDALVWTLSDNGTDTTLTSGTSNLTFVGITGLTDADDFLI